MGGWVGGFVCLPPQSRQSRAVCPHHKKNHRIIWAIGITNLQQHKLCTLSCIIHNSHRLVSLKRPQHDQSRTTFKRPRPDQRFFF